MMGIPIAGSVWLVAAPFLMGLSGGAMWSNVVAGILGAVFAVYPDGGKLRTYGLGLVGVYAIVSPFLFAFGTTALWLNVIAGVAIVAGAYMNMQSERPTGTAAT